MNCAVVWTNWLFMAFIFTADIWQYIDRAVLDDTGQHNRRIEIEVRPLMLVPDTNCFIDHLDGIKSLLASKKYTIVVPLVGE